MSACVITNARMVDGTGRHPFSGDVIVDANRMIMKDGALHKAP